MDRSLETMWDLSYQNGENLLYWPHEEIIRFVSTFVTKRTGFSSFQDLNNLNMKRVLDLGCGGGRHLIFLREMGLDPYGIDLSSVSVSLARAWWSAAIEEEVSGQAVEDRILAGDSGDLPFEDNFFGFAVSHGVLDSMPMVDAKLSIQELARVLVPGGMAYIDLISGDDAQHAREFAGEIVVTGSHERGTIQNFFNMSQIEELLNDQWAINQCRLTRTEDVLTGGYGSRYHLVLKNLVK